MHSVTAAEVNGVKTCFPLHSRFAAVFSAGIVMDEL